MEIWPNSHREKLAVHTESAKKKREDLCRRLRAEYEQWGAGKVYARYDAAELAALDQLLAVGESSRFEDGEIESHAAEFGGDLVDSNVLRGDLQLHLLPLRLLRLTQLLREGDAERAAFQAFFAGMHWARVETVLQEPEIRTLRELRPKWANRRGKGTDPAAVKRAVERLLRANPEAPAAEVYRKVARDLKKSERTVRRHAPLKSLSHSPSVAKPGNTGRPDGSN
jgi:hypothetical protein